MDESPPAGRPGASHLGTIPSGDLGTILTGATVGVVAIMGAVASLRGWIPTGDDAFLSLRTRHLFSGDPILLNNASSAGPSAGSQYNHPGAFPLTLLAPVTLVGGPGSLAFATALVNACWIGLTGWMVRRIAGRTAQLGALVAVALLVWSMGAALLVDPWNPNFGVWPVVALVVATWGVRRGHTRMLAVVVLAASVAFQSHLSLTVLSVAVAGWALVGAIGDWRAARGEPDRRQRVTRAIAVAAAVGAVANAQMLADQLVGTGNLSKIVAGTGFKEATVTIRQIAAVLASKLVLPPWWFRGSWDGPVLLGELPSVGVTLVAGVVALGLTVVAVVLVRRSAPTLSSLFGVLGVAAVAATLVSTKYPLRIGVPLPYFRWVWPLAAIWWAAIAAAAIQFCCERHAPACRSQQNSSRGGSAAPRWGAAVVIVVVLAAAVVPANEDVSPNPAWAQDISEAFAEAAVRETRGAGPVLIEQSIQEGALWVIPALMDQLDAAGIDVRATDAVLVQQTDEAYRADGTERVRLVLRGGSQIDDAPEGASEIARHDELTAAERNEFDALLDRYGSAIAAPGAVRLTSVGESETDAEALRHLTAGELPAAELVRSVPLRLALDRGALSVEGVGRADLDRLTELGARDGGRSMALYLAPVSPAS